MPKVRPVMKSSLEPTEPFEITFPKLTKGLRLLKGMSWINYKTRAKQVPMVRKCEECEEFHPGLLTTNKDGTEHWKCYNCERIAAKAELAARKAERIEAMRRAFVGSMIMRNEYVLQQIGLTGKDPDGYTGQAFYKLSHRDRPRALAWAARKAGQVPPPEPKIIDPQDEEGRARQELARRELARRHLLPFIELFERDYKAGWVHKDICLRLEQFSDDVIAGRSPRLMLFLPPRAGKSLIASQYFPAWHFGRAAQHEIISASYAQSLQIDFSRKIQELLRTPEYRAIFPHTSVMKGNEALERWGISDSKGVRTGGGFLAAGVGGPITGRGAHVLNIDDPVKNREEADSAVTRASTKSWYSSTASTRLAPGGGVLIIQCMTGDTPVLLPNGAQRRLDALRPGDIVATYRDGRLGTAAVVNWASNGYDQCYRLTTASGASVRANARHPFLVLENGDLKWVRTRDLRTGHTIVVVKGSGASGAGSPAPSQAAASPPSAAGSASPTTRSASGLMGIALRRPIRALVGRLISSTGMASLPKSMLSVWLSKAGAALSAVSRQVTMYLRTGAESSALTTATTPAKSADFSATTAMSPWGASDRLPPPPKPWLHTSDFTVTELVSIEDAGAHEVFDVQIEGTENFIANGLVSHNTRWHDDDLSGWILQGQAKAEKEYEETGIWPADAERWQVVSYPAIATADEPYRKRGEALHPERFPIGELLKKKRTMIPRDWAALYQQSPIVEEGAYFEKTMLRFYHGGHPEELDIYASGDLAISKEDAACFTVLMVAGLDFDQKIYMLDERRGQWGADEIVEQIIDIIRVWKPLRFGIEKGQISMAIGPHLERRLREEKISFAVEEMPPTHRGNKEARARPLQGRMSRGEVLFPSGALWTDDHINELLRFPTGVYSDRVDADAWLAQILADVQYRGKKRGRGADKNWRSKLSGYTQKANSGRTSSMAS